MLLKLGCDDLKVDWKDVYNDRLKQIETDKKKSTHEKRWTELAKLMEEEERLKTLLKET